MQPLSILASGMVTGIGLDAASTCAALRAGLANFTETAFVLADEPVVGSAVPLEQAGDARARLVRLVAPAIQACLEHAGAVHPSEIPLLLGVAERGRPGRPPDLDELLLAEIEGELGVRFHPSSRTLAHGRVAGARAVALAAEQIARERRPLCVVAGVDSLLVEATLAALHEEGRLLRFGHPEGFVPGEAGAAVLLGPAGRSRDRAAGGEVVCLGAGFGVEAATIASDRPLRADGLVAAIRAALADAGRGLADVDYRIVDASGEHHPFKEAAIAALRLVRDPRERFDLWSPASGVGETGAGVGPLALGVAFIAARKGYAPGRGALLHFGSDGGERAAVVVRHLAQEDHR